MEEGSQPAYADLVSRVCPAGPTVNGDNVRSGLNEASGQRCHSGPAWMSAHRPQVSCSLSLWSPSSPGGVGARKQSRIVAEHTHESSRASDPAVAAAWGVAGGSLCSPGSGDAHLGAVSALCIRRAEGGPPLAGDKCFLPAPLCDPEKWLWKSLNPTPGKDSSPGLAAEMGDEPTSSHRERSLAFHPSFCGEDNWPLPAHHSWSS